MSPEAQGPDLGGPVGGRTASGTAGMAPEWTRRLRPPVPPEVAVLLVLDGGSSGEAVDPSTEDLVEGAGAALDRALAGGASRTAAWHLLGADALLTCACEAALDRPGAEAMLEGMIRRVVAGPDRRKEAGDRD